MKKWGPIVVLEWIDSCSIRGGHWNSHDDAEQLTVDRIRSIGWIFKETKDSVTLVSHAAQHSIGGEICIPKIAITRRWKLTDPGKMIC